MKKHAPAPTPLEPEELLTAVRRQQRPVRLDDLLRLLDLPRREKKNLQALLESLADRGALIRLPGGKWLHAGQAQRVRGVLNIQRSGVGFVSPEPESGLKTDVFIRPDDLGEAWHGDRVEAILVPGTGKRHTQRNPEGRIVRVLERRQTEITAFATRHKTARGLIFRPSDARLDMTLDVDVSSLARSPEPGTLIRLRVDGRAEESAGGSWQGTALSEIGREDDAAVQERLVKINHQIPMEFPEGVLREAQALLDQRLPDGAPVPAERADLRHIDFVTIDGADARDFDDAVHVARETDGWTLHVAIADVSWFVRPGSGLDREARERGNSCYFPLSVEPMLPEALSNDLCSLRPGEDRFVLAVRLRCDTRGAVQDSTLMSAVIRSRARLTYTAVQDALTAGAQADTATAPLVPMLREAAELTKMLRAARLRRGALDMDLPEPAYEVNDQGRVVAIRKARTLFSHQLIEECMLAANEAVARFLEAKGIPFPARVHPEPDPDRLASLFHTLHGTRLPAELLALIPPEPKATAIRPLLEAARDTPQAFIVNRLVLRSMMQARYAPELSGHFGLASEAYCHFTSPIRRYADLVVHRAVRLALGQAVGPVPARHKLLVITDQCNARERAAQEAERETARRMACLLLLDRETEVFEGVISGVIDFGFFVELADMPVEGMVRLTRLDDDWYAYDPDRGELSGAGTGRTFRLGDPVTVRLEHVDLGRLEIDLDLVRGGTSGSVARARAAFSRQPSPRKARGQRQAKARSGRVASSGPKRRGARGGGRV